MNSHNPRVLVAVPYHEKKRYCLPQLFDALNNLTYQNKEVVIRFDPNEYGSKNSCKMQREFFRKLMIEKDFDYLYFLGADTIPPNDVIERMLAHNKPIVGGVYWGRNNADNGNVGSAVAWLHGVDQKQQREMFLNEEKTYYVSGMGADCVLFSRNFLEKFTWLDWEQNDDDYPVYDLAIKQGFPVLLDCSIQCKHYFGEETCRGYSYKAKEILF